MIEVTGKVSPSNLPEDFSFFSIVVGSFVVNAVPYNDTLSKASTFFASLGESSHNNETQPINTEGSDAQYGKIIGISSAGVSTILLVVAFLCEGRQVVQMKASRLKKYLWGTA
jgi:hypothetical protein